VYRPGYWNIDKFDSNVADEIADVSQLKYDDCTFEEVVSSQLIEHFDLVRSRYVLSEWFRVLKPNGTLVLETPDLAESMKGLLRGKAARQKQLMSWVFGIDSPGMQHKACFTFDLLKAILEEAGFVDIRRQEQRTHGYAPGMRVACRRPEGAEDKFFEAVVRKQVLIRMKNPDSYLLAPMEESLRQVFELARGQGVRGPEYLDYALARAAVCHPALATAVLDAAEGLSVIQPEVLTKRRDAVKALLDMDFTSRAFALWMRRGKGPDLESDFRSFLDRMERMALDAITGREEAADGLDYFKNLPPEHISILDFGLAMMEGRKRFNLALKAFAQKDFERSKEEFGRAAAINPLNPCIYWNMARLELATGNAGAPTFALYNKAIDLAGDRADKAQIIAERNSLAGGVTPPMVPIQMPWE